MPRNPRSRTLQIVAGTAATTGFGMIPLHRLPTVVQGGYVLLPAALTSGLLLRALLRRKPLEEADGGVVTAEQGPSRTAAHDGRRLPTVRQTALCLAPGILVAGVGAGSILLDRGIENRLRRRGVTAPRVWMGLAAGALSLVLDVLGERISDPQDPEEPVDTEGDGLTSPPSAP